MTKVVYVTPDVQDGFIWGLFALKARPVSCWMR